METSVDTIMVTMLWSWRMLPRLFTLPLTSLQIPMCPEPPWAGSPTLLPLLQSEQLSATARDLMTVLVGNRQQSLDEAGAEEAAEGEVVVVVGWLERKVACWR